ncbi:MAG: HAMP domain-containing sensor histidine kinase [Chitinophagaceae bacterium]
MKISTKIAILFTLLVLLILTVAALVMLATIEKNVSRDFRKRLEAKASSVSVIYSSRPSDYPTLLKMLNYRMSTTLSNKTVIILNSDDHEVYKYNDTETIAPVIDTNWINQTKRTGQASFTNKGRNILLKYFNKEASPPYMVMVAAENTVGSRYTSELKKALWITAPFVIILALVIGFLLYRGLIMPVKTIIHDARLISSSNLSHRLHIGKQKDELAELKRTMNDLLQRLEESFNTQRRFISNASHELSTPLTAISSQLEVSLMTDNSKEYYRNVIQSVLDDTRGLHHLTHTLLQIAKGGTAGALQLDKVRIDEMLLKVHADILKQHPEYILHLNFGSFPENDDGCSVYGNELLVYTIFRNIAINGCKYSPDNTIAIDLDFTENTIIFNAANKSEHLTPEEIELLFEPFYRSSNAEDKEGYGLGLALTKKLVQLHKGQISVDYQDDNNILFTIIFPSINASNTSA